VGGRAKPGGFPSRIRLYLRGVGAYMCVLFSRSLAHAAVHQPTAMPDFRKKARTFLSDTFGRTSRSVSRAHSPSPAPPDPPPPPLASASTSLAYASPPKSSSAPGTTGSVIHELLATARDGADMCLPLKAALVGVVKIWDICEVSCSKIACTQTNRDALAN